MSGKTKIEWCTDVWNPLRGCSRVSEGCRNCYAERVAARFGGPGLPYEGLTTPAGNWNGTVKLIEDHLTDPLRWKKPRKIFVNSMSDLFHESVPFDWIDKIFDVMRKARHHTFQVLTKRPERMTRYFDEPGCRRSGGVLPNAWLGVSVENQPTADERILELLRCPAAVRWLSVEPMLGPVDLGALHARKLGVSAERPYIDWVVCGGESGPGARPMHPDWVRGLRDQCVNAGVPFFFQQWGAFGPWIDEDKANHDGLEKWGHIGIQPDGSYGDIAINPDSMLITNYTRGFNPENCHAMAKCGKKAAGRMLDGRTWDEFPQAVQA